MRSNAPILMAVALLAAVSVAARAEALDPRTPAGQLAACGGANNWKAIGYVDFEVKVADSAGVKGPYRYRWDKRDGFVRVTGRSSTGTWLDAVVDLGSRTGGAWEDGNQLTGQRLTDVTGWALEHFGEDRVWLTFPLEWAAPGVTARPLPDAPCGEGRTCRAVGVKSPLGSWQALLDPGTGRVLQTVAKLGSGDPRTETWEAWQQKGGVFFSGRHTIAETGQTVEVVVTQAQPNPPTDAL